MKFKDFDYKEFLNRTDKRIGWLDTPISSARPDGLIATSKVAVLPTRDKIVIMNVFKVSGLAAITRERMTKESPVFKEVVGIGPEVKDVRIGDIVELTPHSPIDYIYIKGNILDVDTIEEIHTSLSTAGLAKSVYIIEYTVANSHAINVIHHIDAE